ncbi:2-phospho-L-lactate transferase [Methermicoccus shengliensis]|nr:MAG: 2-phospho-L-lactate transferase [Euryarchaeota archaeon 55_53]KUK30595.1 MAG: 2-phospho-L-lactate transferase [Methanosarcinales archeaon 56_1174]MDI3488559.1 2-phospho-L-lactate transferase [Methanosarcinales archaeon]MDN5295418.1 2-phospho-L-lactate transferase [Methanosarcinales archaeon]
MSMMVLSGGTGTPKLLWGLKELLAPDELTVVVNTAEDVWVSGGLVCPDIDTVLYLFSDRLDTSRWWGVRNDTFSTADALRGLGMEEPLRIGDIDRATHLARAKMLGEGLTLTQATLELCHAMGVQERVLPMCDEPVSTMLETSEGRMHFQQFWVVRKGEPDVLSVSHEGLEGAHLTREVGEALRENEWVVIGPSNPITSIRPILGVGGMRRYLSRKRVLAISPIIGGRAVSGPAEKLMRACGLEPSSLGVSQLYEDFLDLFIIDHRDDVHPSQFAVDTVRADTLMSSKHKSISLATRVLELMEEVG